MIDVLGPERAATLLPAMELYEAGATLTLSSDWDADTLSPLVKMQTVLTRPYGRSFPDLETVIPMLTLNPAYLLGHADRTGSITVGKYADLVVIDQDIFGLPAENISMAEVTRTYLQGQLIFGGSVDDTADLDESTEVMRGGEFTVSQQEGYSGAMVRAAGFVSLLCLWAATCFIY